MNEEVYEGFISGFVTQEDLKERDYLKKWKEESELCFSLKQVNLHKLNNKPINENINASFEVIQGAYYNVLFNDPNWHFFYEDSYNIIRCSMAYYLDLLAYLDECGVSYEEHGLWLDEQRTTLENQRVFMTMFHSFSLMAVSNYKKMDIRNISDRVIHCFLNHQKLYLDEVATKFWGSLWEPNIISELAFHRAHYIGWCVGVNQSKEKIKHAHKELKDKEDELNEGIDKYNISLKFKDSIWYKLHNFFNRRNKNDTRGGTVADQAV